MLFRSAPSSNATCHGTPWAPGATPRSAAPPAPQKATAPPARAPAAGPAATRSNAASTAPHTAHLAAAKDCAESARVAAPKLPPLGYRASEAPSPQGPAQRQSIDCGGPARSEEHTSELQSLMRIS